MSNKLASKNSIKHSWPIPSSLCWQFTAPLIRLFRFDRVLWQHHVKSLNFDGGWKNQQSVIRPHLAFFLALPYRPDYTAQFDDERKLLAAAFAVANEQYFSNNLSGYRQTILNIGLYLDHAMHDGKSNISGSDIWTDYLHGKATIEHIAGNSSNAACLNSEVKQLCAAKNGRPLDILMYEGCTMCCRVESLSEHEHYLLTALDFQSQEIATKFEQLPDPVAEDMNDFYTNKFYIHMLKCKIQAHMNEPNKDVIKEALRNANSCLSYINGDDINTYNVTVPFYESLLSKLFNEDINTTRELYEKSLMALQESQVPYFCLLRIPESVSSSLANHVRRERLDPDITFLNLNKTKTTWFFVRILLVISTALIIPVVLLPFFSPLTQLIMSFTTTKGAWHLLFAITTTLACIGISIIKQQAEKQDKGLVNPQYIQGADVAFSLLIALSAFFVTSACEQVISR